MAAPPAPAYAPLPAFAAGRLAGPGSPIETTESKGDCWQSEGCGRAWLPSGGGLAKRLGRLSALAIAPIAACCPCSPPSGTLLDRT